MPVYSNTIQQGPPRPSGFQDSEQIKRYALWLLSVFLFHQFDQEKISSMVLRIELLGGRHLVDLNTSVEMIFRVDTHRDMAVSLFMSHFI